MIVEAGDGPGTRGLSGAPSAPTVVPNDAARPPVFTPPATPMTAALPAPSAERGSRAAGHAPATILELADAVSDDERSNVIDLVDERSISTETRDFAQVLDQFSRNIDATPEELAESAERDPGSDIDLRELNHTAPQQPRPESAPAPLPTEPMEAVHRAGDDVDLRNDPFGTAQTAHIASAAPQRRHAAEPTSRASSTATRRACRTSACPRS